MTRKIVLKLIFMSLFICLLFSSNLSLSSDGLGPYHFSPLTVPKTIPKYLRLGAIKFRSGSGGNFDLLEDKIINLINDHPSIDLIVTPEYSLMPSVPRLEHTVEIRCGQLRCEVSPYGRDSQSIVDAIKNIQMLAKEANVNIVLATVYERLDIKSITDLKKFFPSGEVYFMTALIIEGVSGNIIDIRRKTTQQGVPVGDPGCGWPRDPVCHDAMHDLTFPTVQSFELKSNMCCGKFTIFPVICGDRSDEEMLDYAASSGIHNIHLLVNSEREGDVPYETMTQNIQNGLDPGFGWDWGIEETFITPYIEERDIIIEDSGYLVVAEGGTSHGGIINLAEEPSPLKILDITDDYVYGEIFYPSRAVPYFRE